MTSSEKDEKESYYSCCDRVLKYKGRVYKSATLSYECSLCLANYHVTLVYGYEREKVTCEKKPQECCKKPMKITKPKGGFVETAWECDECKRHSEFIRVN